MAEYILREHSPRHGIPFNHLPTIKGSMYGGSIIAHYRDSYGPILDCVFEMADQIATSNGVSTAAAVDQVCRDEGWRVLPRHRAEIVKRLEA